MGHRSCTPRDLLQRLSSQLEAVEAAVAPGAAAGLQGKAEALLAAARLRAGGAGGGAADLEPLVDAASLEAVFSILSGYAEALAKMHQVAQRDARDVGVMQAGGA
jgi:nuclear pore complex protein Nup54